MTLHLPSPRTADPMTAPPLRWGVLGTGWIAGRFVEALHTHTRQRVVAVGSRTAGKGAEFAARHGVERSVVGYEAVVSDAEVDVVYVATPHSEHRDNALLAIAAGKPVLVEKAFTRNLAEATEVVDAARAAGVAAMEAMWARFLPHMDVVRQVLADGALGEIETAFADHGQWFPKDPDFRLFDPAKAGGAMLDLGVYPVSFAHFALGTPGAAVAAGTKAFTGVDRQISALLTGFERHPMAHGIVTTTLAAPTPTSAFIAGDEARLEIPGPFYGPQVVTVRRRDGGIASSDEPAIRDHAGLCYQAAHLATVISEGRPESDLLPLDETLAVMATMDELRRQVGVTLPGETL
ncbi:Gfo/Idh/MocA family protein [Tessaracoccus sp. G1721]